MTEIILIFVVAICIWGLWLELTDAGRWDSKDVNRELRKRRKKQGGKIESKKTIHKTRD